MKLLLDANISLWLAAKLKFHFTDCLHVDHIGLTNLANDKEIWKYALANGMVIVTNDDDFF